MKRLAFLSTFLILLATVLLHKPVQAGPDPNATPEPAAKPTGLNDPNYQILKTIEAPDGSYKVHLLTEGTTDPESPFCGGWDSSCFIFVDDKLVESAQFISIHNGQEEHEFRGKTLLIRSLEILDESTITFRTVFADANHSSSVLFCLEKDSERVERVESRTSEYDPETETLNQTVEVNLDAFCAPTLFPHQTFIPFVGGPF